MGQLLIDDANAWCGVAVSSGERPAPHNGNAERREVILTHDLKEGERSLRERQNRAPGHAVGRPDTEAGDRKRETGGRVRNGRVPPKLVHHP